MKKIISIITSCILITSMTGCTNKNKEEEKTQEIKQANNLDFTFDVNPNNFEIYMEIDNKKEIISEPIKTKEVENLKKSEDEISWTYPKENINVKVKKENKYLDVDITSTKNQENSFSWPKVSGESFILPIQEGKFIPSNDKYWKKFLDDQVYNVVENFSMQFFSINKKDFTVSYIIKNKFNNEIKFNTKDNINFEFTHEYPSINENKTYGFRIYATPKNVVDVAKTYKNYVIEQGEFKTLAQKSKDNKNIDKLKGAPHIYFWDKSIISQDDIKWNEFKENLPKDLEDHIKHLLSTKTEDSEECINVFDSIKTKDYVDKYQRSQIVMALNKVMLLEDFYDENVFKDLSNEDKAKIDKGIVYLNKVELVELNKNLLKSKLKNCTTPTSDWSKHNTIDLINEMKNSGINNAWIGFDDIEAGYVSPELVKKANEYGYLVAPYDSYHSIHKPGQEKWSAATFEDPTLYDKATIENKKGKKLTGFQGEGRKLNPTLSLDSVKDRVNEIMKDNYDFNSWFIDCDATGEIYDDYSKDHITTQEEDLEARLNRMAYIRDEKKMVIGSEGGNDFACSTISFAHGLETPAFPEEVFISPKYSLPLFRLVYNDSVVTSYHWLWGTFKIKDDVESRMMREVLYNTAPMYHLDRVEWDKHKDDIISHTKVWSEFNKKAIDEEMTNFKFLSDDRMVQMTEFGDNLKVVANFSNEKFEYDGDIIESGSLVIYDGENKEVYKP